MILTYSLSYPKFRDAIASNKSVSSVYCTLNLILDYRYSKIKDGKLTHAEELSRILPTTVSIVKALNSLDVTDLEGERTIVKASHCNRYRVHKKRLLRTCLIFFFIIVLVVNPQL